MIALAAAAGVAIENARLYEEAERRQRWLRRRRRSPQLLADATEGQTPCSWWPTGRERSPGADVAWVVAGPTARSLELRVVSGVDVDLDALRERVDARTRWRRRWSGPGRRSRSATWPPTHAPSDPVLDLSGGRRLGPGGRGAAGVRQRRGRRARPRLDARAQRRASTPWTLALPASFAEQAALALQIARCPRGPATSGPASRTATASDETCTTWSSSGSSRSVSASRARPGSSEAPEVSARLERAVDELDGTIKDIRRTIFALGDHGRQHGPADRDRADREPRRRHHEVPADPAYRRTGADPGRRSSSRRTCSRSSAKP